MDALDVDRREKTSAALYFKYNTQLGPPYQVLVDTNFINFAIKNKVMRALPSSMTLQATMVCCRNLPAQRMLQCPRVPRRHVHLALPARCTVHYPPG
jgi:hypothetical protein